MPDVLTVRNESGRVEDGDPIGTPGPLALRMRAVLLTVSALPLAGCSPFHHGLLAAAGPVADHERHLFMIVCIVMLFVIGPVILLTPVFAWHYRLANTKSAYRPQWAFNWSLEGLIWIPPTLIVVGLAFLVWRDTQRPDLDRPLPSDRPATQAQAVALDWKWLFIYPTETSPRLTSWFSRPTGPSIGN